MSLTKNNKGFIYLVSCLLVEQGWLLLPVMSGDLFSSFIEHGGCPSFTPSSCFLSVLFSWTIGTVLIVSGLFKPDLGSDKNSDLSLLAASPNPPTAKNWLELGNQKIME